MFFTLFYSFFKKNFVLISSLCFFLVKTAYRQLYNPLHNNKHKQHNVESQRNDDMNMYENVKNSIYK